MNKIFSKCRDFGIVNRISNLDKHEALNCVKQLKQANLPLCLIDIRYKNSMEILKEINDKEDLFIAVEGVDNLNDVYIAAGNGAQFYILEKFDFEFFKQLKESGFSFIPQINSIEELNIVTSLGVDCIKCDNISVLEQTTLYNVIEEPYNLDKSSLFKIVDIPTFCDDYGLWANNIIKNQLNLNYTKITITDNIDTLTDEFVRIFSSTNCCKIINGIENTITLECSDFNRAVQYLKWSNLFIDPLSCTIVNDRIVSGNLEKKLYNFRVVLEEKL